MKRKDIAKKKNRCNHYSYIAFAVLNESQKFSRTSNVTPFADIDRTDREGLQSRKQHIALLWVGIWFSRRIFSYDLFNFSE